MKFNKNNLNKRHCCPICKEISNFIFNSKHNLEIYRCQNKICNHFFTPPNSKNQGICTRNEDIEEESNQFLDIFGERNERLLKLLMSYYGDSYKAQIRFLDYGAGNAHISRTFKNILGDKVKIYCLEENPKCLSLYSKYGLNKLSKLSDLNEKIDLIYMIEVIEHLEDPISMLRQLRESIKDSGVLFISTPIGAESERYTNAYDTPSHLHFFSETSLNLTLEKSGFEKIDYRYYPEMYPVSSLNFYRKLKVLLKGFIINLTQGNKNPNRLHHLVGPTRPTIKNTSYALENK